MCGLDARFMVHAGAAAPGSARTTEEEALTCSGGPGSSPRCQGSRLVQRGETFPLGRLRQSLFHADHRVFSKAMALQCM